MQTKSRMINHRNLKLRVNRGQNDNLHETDAMRYTAKAARQQGTTLSDSNRNSDRFGENARNMILAVLVFVGGTHSLSLKLHKAK